MDRTRHLGQNSAQEITLSDLEEFIIAPGDVFYQKENGRPIKLIPAGQIIDQEKLKKYSLVADKILIQKLINPGNIHVLVEFFKEFKSAQFERDAWNMRPEIMMAFGDAYWKGLRPSSLLDLAIVGHKSFLATNSDQLAALGRMGDDLFLRNSILATLGVYLAVVMGHLDAAMLGDIYHSILLSDFKMMDCLSTNSLHALDNMRLGKRDESLNLLPYEQKGINEHIQLGDILKKEWSDLFHYGDQSDSIRLYHEQTRGQSTFLQSHEDEWIDLDAIFVLLEKLLPYGRMDLKMDDGLAFLKRIWNAQENQKMIPLRLYHLIGEMMNSLPTLEEYYESRGAA